VLLKIIIGFYLPFPKRKSFVMNRPSESLRTSEISTTGSNPKDPFQEETRIYWTSLLASIYDRLNDIGKAIVHQYLKEKPWADQEWFWKPLSFSGDVFLRLVLKIGFEVDHGLEHLQELGARLRTIYAFDMNKKSGETRFSLPNPPVRAVPPKSEAAVEPQIVKLSAEEKAALLKKAMEIYQLLGEKGYQTIHRFLTMPPRPGIRNGPGRHATRSPTWFKNLLSYLTPAELKDTVAKLEEIFRDDNNVDDTELARRVEAKKESAKGDSPVSNEVPESRFEHAPLSKEAGNALCDRAREIYTGLGQEGYRSVHNFLTTSPMPVHKELFSNESAFNTPAFNKALAVLTDQELKDLLTRMEAIFLSDNNMDSVERRRRTGKILEKKRTELSTHACKIYNTHGWRAFNSIVKLAGGESFRTYILRIDVEDLEKLVAEMEKISEEINKKNTECQNLLAHIKTIYSGLSPAELDKFRVLCKWSESSIGYWHQIAPMTFKELVEVASLIGSVRANHSKLSESKEDHSEKEKSEKEKSAENKDVRKNLLVRIHKVWCSLNQVGLDYLRVYFKSVGKKDFGWHLVEPMSFEELVEVASVIDKIASDPRNLERWAEVTTPKPIPGGEKKETAKLLTRATHIYRELEIDTKRKAYKAVCDIFWGGAGPNCAYLDDSAFETATSAFTRVNAQILVDILEQLSSNPVSMIDEEKERLKIATKATALFRKLNRGGYAQVHYLMGRLSWVGLDRSAPFTSAHFERLLANCGLAGTEELLQLVEGVFAKPEYRSSDNIEDVRDRARIGLAGAVTTLFNSLNAEGREIVVAHVIVLSWVDSHRVGALIDQDFSEFINALRLGFVKEIQAIVEKAYADPANRQ
jgi:hypothetical protein